MRGWPRVGSGRAWRVAAVIAAAAAAVFGAVLVTKPFGEATLTAFTDLGQLAAATLGGCGAAWAAFQAWRTERQRLATSWGLIAAGVLAWAWGEAIWTGYEVILGEDVPFPSLADVGFLLLPVLAGLGLLLWPVGAAERRERVGALLDGALIGAGLLVISWATSLGATIQAGGENTTAIVISAAYPVGDVILTALVVVLLARAAPTSRASLLILSAGLIALAVADSAFMYGTSTNSYSSGGLLDAGWFAGFLAVGVAGLALGPVPVSRSRRVVVTRQRFWLPYVPAGLAMLTIFGALLSGRQLHLVEVLSALVIVVAVGARQFLLMSENQELLSAVAAGEAEARRSGFNDPLTGLATAPLFEDRLKQALRRSNRDGQPRALLLVDVDDFSAVNRSFGGAAAEGVLIEVATRLRRVVRAADSVARLRDDEFAVLLEEGHRAPDAVAERIVEGLRTTVDVGGQPVPITASVGLAVGGTRRMNAAPVELITSAQHALLQAKEAGKDRYAAVAGVPDATR